MKIIQNFLKKGLTNKPLKGVKGIVIHYVANPGSSAKANRNYWENLGSGIGAHYIVDLDGTVLHTVPENMMAYHVGSKTYTPEALKRLSSYPNDCTIGIEMTHPDASGKPTTATYKAAVELAASLCKKYKLTEKDLWLHKEVVGWKLCHKYYVEHPDAWKKFKADVANLLNGVKHTVQKGDTLWGLAKKYGVTVEQIKKLNNLKSDVLSIGQILRIK